MLLDFTVENYRCYAEETTLDLTHEPLRTLTPRPGSTWQEQTWRVAALFGANASGKSTLLDALNCLHHAVGGKRDIPYQPFALDHEHSSRTSRFSISFTHDGQRYSYSVEAHAWGISREELWAAGQRWRKVFIRTQAEGEDTPTIDAGASLRGATREVSRITTIKDLFLAVALRYKHATLAPIARSLRAVRFIHHSDEERSARLRWLMSRLAEKPTWWSDVSDAIAHSADLGITRVELEERDLPPELLEQLQRIIRLGTEEGEDEAAEIPEEILREVQRSLVFIHHGADGQEHRLSLGAQSQGTLTWLATLGPAIDALRLGQVLVIDELDASLHPTLTATLVDLFKDPDLNTHGAQLVFTTHDTSLLDNSPVRLLESGEVWLCEKNTDGSSELIPLSTFTSTRKGTNKQRRYLVGAFGAIPHVDTSQIRRFVSTSSDGK
ncbi:MULTISPECIES: ATP-binding protein [unclassified Actinomyces]|uniref:AAA family ATPase n=1 Tax=unclassified Actinomyces TaxID=2609248 RepID=UPI002016B0FF|nr:MULTISPECIES: ATP-binding protein [unclassified Actinomyces]MCL3777453.1 ATP-binding protein [Actinomyces sp. AC-20-1]MCL3790177.1 ATP-binding protein [Actinomyces sp. 187325]MCL3792302.1 ATP-binding protein [Actinomyces sp. 186855]MCL3794869.1 ATP-binding protein [Actinomyces sp. 217892]